VTNPLSSQQMTLYQHLYQRHRLRMRVRGSFHLSDLNAPAGEAAATAFRDKWLVDPDFLRAGAALADQPPSVCANALEQVAALETQLPVCRLVPPDARQYLEDAQRPAELARVRQLVSASCGSDPPARAAADAAAKRLHQGRSPQCAFERSRPRYSDSGNSRCSAYIMSRCSRSSGSSAASVCASRVPKAARVGSDITHCSGGNGRNSAMQVAP
jgi:hypothetical protein